MDWSIVIVLGSVMGLATAWSMAATARSREVHRQLSWKADAQLKAATAMMLGDVDIPEIPGITVLHSNFETGRFSSDCSLLAAIVRTDGGRLRHIIVVKTGYDDVALIDIERRTWLYPDDQAYGPVTAEVMRRAPSSITFARPRSRGVP